MNQETPFSQLQLHFTDPIQYDYEAIRPVILFAESIAQRSRETEMPRSTMNEKARRFVTDGMLGLVDQRTQINKKRSAPYPDPIARLILYLKQLYPPIHYREIVRIIGRKFGYKTNHHTLKKFLVRHPMPLQMALELRPFHSFSVSKLRFAILRKVSRGPISLRHNLEFSLV